MLKVVEVEVFLYERKLRRDERLTSEVVVVDK